jgi:hypothetical protein
VIDQYRTRAHGGQGTCFTGNYRAHIVIIAETGKDDLGTGNRFSYCSGCFANIVPQPTLTDGMGAIVYNHCIAALTQPSGHGITHYTKS